MTRSHLSLSSCKQSASVRLIFRLAISSITVVAFHKKLPDVGKKLIGVGFVIIEQADALVAQAAVFSTGEVGSLGSACRRWIYNRH